MKINQAEIKTIIEDLLRAMDFAGEVTLDNSDDNFLRINIQSVEAAYLIGRGGEHLKALQHICRAILHRKFEEPLQFIIDINDYQKNRLDLLKEMAASMAEEVVGQREPRWLAPMNAYERRIIHMALANFEGVKTESEGEGEERRVVIRPK